MDFPVYYHYEIPAQNDDSLSYAFNGNGEIVTYDTHDNFLKAEFSPSSRISDSRERSDIAFYDEGIALAIAEEKNARDDLLAGGRKLLGEVNSAFLKPYLIPVDATPPSPLDLMAVGGNPEMVISWNIFGAYGGDIPIAEQQILREMENYLTTQGKLRIPQKYIQPLPTPKIETIPQQLFELCATRRVLMLADQMSIQEAILTAISEMQEQFETSAMFESIAMQLKNQENEDNNDSNRGYLPLLNALIGQLNKGLQPNKIEQFKSFLMKNSSKATFLDDLLSKLPENRKEREQELWLHRRLVLQKTLESVIVPIPTVILLNELNIDQYKDLKHMLSPNWNWVSFSNVSGLEADEIPFDPDSNKYQNGHGFLNTIVLSPDWEVLEVEKEWLSATPTIPSPTEGGSNNNRLIVAVKTLNKQTGKVKLFINTHVDHFAGAHAISMARINAFVKRVSQEGAIPFYLAGDFNMFEDANGADHYATMIEGKQDFREGQNPEFQGFFAPLSIAHASFAGFPRDAFKNEFDDQGNLQPKALDHIFLDEQAKIAYSFRNAAVHDDCFELLSPEHPDYEAYLQKRSFASDHFLNGVVTIDPTDSALPQSPLHR